ncbi:MAG: hypothetical protein ACTIAS_13675, partial [Pseudomonas helleri]|uniref:hypothetical protein n=1 Tax=Pseudomonas helleri TaxID=1608996 RepID=UPI003F9CDA6A
GSTVPERSGVALSFCRRHVYGGEVTTYAAKPEPERKPWRKRASLLDQAFSQEIQKIEKELKAEES